MKRSDDAEREAALLAEEERLESLLAASSDDDEWDRIEAKLDRVRKERATLRRMSKFTDSFSKEAIAKHCADGHRKNGSWTRAEIEDEKRVRAEREAKRRADAQGKGQAAGWAERRERRKRAERRGACFIQFLLALLALFDEQFELMEAAMSYGVIQNARAKSQRCKRDKEYFRLFKRWIPEDEPPDYDGTDLHKAIAMAQIEVGVRGSVTAQLQCWRDVRKRLRKLNVDPDNHAVLIRIPTHRAFGLRDGRVREKAINGNDVRVLLAITSKLGRDNDYVRMTREEIAYRAAGAKDEKQWKELGRPALLHPERISRSIKKLAEVSGLFSRVLARKGTLNYFAHSQKLSVDQLAQLVQEDEKPVTSMRVKRV